MNSIILKLKPYVSLDVRLTNSQKKAVFGKFPSNGLTPEHFLKVAQAQQSGPAKEPGDA